MHFVKKLLITSVGLTIIAIVAFLVYFFVPLPFFSNKLGIGKNTPWGVDFSQSQAEYLGLDWKTTYSAMINDLGVKNIKLHGSKHY